MTGKVVKWNEARGFGFIQPAAAGAKEVFAQVYELKNRGLGLAIGDEVCFEVVETPKGLRATGIEVLRRRPKREFPNVLPLDVSGTNEDRPSGARYTQRCD